MAKLKRKGERESWKEYLKEVHNLAERGQADCISDCTLITHYR